MRFTAVASLLLTLILLAAAPASAEAEVVTCGQVITTDTTVENDLSCGEQDPGESALRIGAAGITLDLNGHRIFGDSHAIVNEGYDDVTIRNGTVVANDDVVMVTGVSRNTVDHLVVSGIVDGVSVLDSDHTRVVSNVLQGATMRVGGPHNTVSQNRMQGFEGVLSVGGSRNRVVDNSTDSSGIQVSGDHHRVARNHIFVDLIETRFALTDGAVIDNVIVGASFDHGEPILEIDDSSRTVFRGNAVFRGRSALVAGSDNVLRRNVWFASPGDGLFVAAGVTGTRLIDNLAVQNADDGFDVEAPGTRLRGNTADKNGDLGIEAVPGVVDGGGNRASGNGNPLQCTNVFCG
jgi:hypothetical protein